MKLIQLSLAGILLVAGSAFAQTAINLSDAYNGGFTTTTAGGAFCSVTITDTGANSTVDVIPSRVLLKGGNNATPEPNETFTINWNGTAPAAWTVNFWNINAGSESVQFLTAPSSIVLAPGHTLTAGNLTHDGTAASADRTVATFTGQTAVFEIDPTSNGSTGGSIIWGEVQADKVPEPSSALLGGLLGAGLLLRRRR